MLTQKLLICGMPGSGKTTFLAALWHLVTSREIATALRFGSLRNGDFSHLNSIARRWRDAEAQERTLVQANRLVSMNFVDVTGKQVRVDFPDLSGESYRRMWEERDCDPGVAEIVRMGHGVLLFVHADNISHPLWVTELTGVADSMGLASTEAQEEQEVPWHPSLSPTQVQIVDLLQLLRRPPLDIGPRRLIVMLSAWDKVEAEGLTPAEFLAGRLSLLDQYLRNGVDGWVWRVCGVSAQGGDLEIDAEMLQAKDLPSTRIRLVDGDTESHDLTEPLAWLMA